MGQAVLLSGHLAPFQQEYTASYAQREGEIWAFALVTDQFQFFFFMFLEVTSYMSIIPDTRQEYTLDRTRIHHHTQQAIFSSHHSIYCHVLGIGRNPE